TLADRTGRPRGAAPTPTVGQLTALGFYRRRSSEGRLTDRREGGICRAGARECVLDPLHGDGVVDDAEVIDRIERAAILDRDVRRLRTDGQIRREVRRDDLVVGRGDGGIRDASRRLIASVQVGEERRT